MWIQLAVCNLVINVSWIFLHQGPNLMVKGRIFRKALMIDYQTVASPSSSISEERNSKLNVLLRGDFA